MRRHSPYNYALTTSSILLMRMGMYLKSTCREISEPWGIGVYYHDKQETQRVGMVPDMEVKPTIQGIREGRDEVLEKAILYIKGKNKVSYYGKLQ